MFVPSISFCYVGNKMEGLSQENDGISVERVFSRCMYFKDLEINGDSEKVYVNTVSQNLGKNANKEMDINGSTQFPVVLCGMGTKNDF